MTTTNTNEGRRVMINFDVNGNMIITDAENNEVMTKVAKTPVIKKEEPINVITSTEEIRTVVKVTKEISVSFDFWNDKYIEKTIIKRYENGNEVSREETRKTSKTKADLAEAVAEHVVSEEEIITEVKTVREEFKPSYNCFDDNYRRKIIVKVYENGNEVSRKESNEYAKTKDFNDEPKKKNTFGF